MTTLDGGEVFFMILISYLFCFGLVAVKRIDTLTCHSVQQVIICIYCFSFCYLLLPFKLYHSMLAIAFPVLLNNL